MTSAIPLNDPSALRKAARISLSGSFGFLAFVAAMIATSDGGENIALQVVFGYLLCLLYGGFGLVLLGRARALGRDDRIGSLGLTVTIAIIVTGVMLLTVASATLTYIVLSATGFVQP